MSTDQTVHQIFMHLKAGGLGLNLTGANKVVIFDPNWNQTPDLQAQDRAYRIGQRRNLQVFRLVSTGTIEENMYLRQIYKQQLLTLTLEDENARRYFYAVQGNRKQKGEIFGVKNMFILRTGEYCITRDIIKRNERVESAVEGFDTAKYVPPVVRVEEDEEYEDSLVADGNSAPVESEDLFAQFFSSDESDVEMNKKDYNEMEDVESSDVEEGNSNKNSSGNGKNYSRTGKKRSALSVSDRYKSDDASVVKTKPENNQSEKCKSKERPKVRFQDPPKSKVKPVESRTGNSCLYIC